MSRYMEICMVPSRPPKPAPLNPALPFLRHRRIIAFYQNMIARARTTRPRTTYGHYLHKLHYYRTK